jgi:hypothetical protein
MPSKAERDRTQGQGKVMSVPPALGPAVEEPPDEYPKSLYHENGKHKVVADADEEAAAEKAGFSTDASLYKHEG